MGSQAQDYFSSPRRETTDDDNISTVGRTDTRDMEEIHPVRTMTTAHEGDEYFDDKPTMSKSRTMEEQDFKATYGKRRAQQADREPNSINFIFIFILLTLFVVAISQNYKRAEKVPGAPEYLPCQFGSSQKRLKVRDPEDPKYTPRPDLLSNCLRPWLFAERLQPTKTSTVFGIEETETATSISTGSFLTVVTTAEPGVAEIQRRQERDWSNGNFTVTSFSTGSASAKATTAVPGVSRSKCANEGEFLCNGSQFYGICTHGTVIWQHVANGTACKNDKIIGTGIYGTSPTGMARLQRRQERHWSNSTSITAPFSTGSPTDQAPGAIPSMSSCNGPDGILVCNGPKLQGLCNNGTVIWQPVAEGTACEDNRIVGTGFIPHAPVRATTLSSFGTGRGGATAWGPPFTPSSMVTTTKPGRDISTADPTGNALVHGNNTLFRGTDLIANKKGYPHVCQREPDRRVGDPVPCFCFLGGTSGASKIIPEAIEHACEYFSTSSLGPAGPDWKQVLAYNHMYHDSDVKDDRGRILLKMEYWGDVNGNDNRYGGPCLIFKTEFGLCKKAFESLLPQCDLDGDPAYPNGSGGYGMDSCVMWTIDVDPSNNNKDIPESIDGNNNFFLYDNPALKPESSQSFFSPTWPTPTLTKSFKVPEGMPNGDVTVTATPTSKSWTYPYPDPTPKDTDFHYPYPEEPTKSIQL